MGKKRKEDPVLDLIEEEHDLGIVDYDEPETHISIEITTAVNGYKVGDRLQVSKEDAFFAGLVNQGMAKEV